MTHPDIHTLIQLVHETRPLITETENAKNVTVKGYADFVTMVDTSVQEFLKEKLFKIAPHVQFMGEENHMDQIDPKKPSWILDPIDGTTNLIFDYHHSAVSLAYYDGNRIRMGVVYNPFSGETFYASRGQGAFLDEKPIRVTKHSSLDQSLISIGTSPYDRELARENFRIFLEVFQKSLDIRRSGSAALDLAYVACGRLDGFFEKNLKPWDFAAGSVILEEAGGQITNDMGQPLDFCKNQNIVSSNGLIHEKLLECLCPLDGQSKNTEVDK